MEKNSRWLFSCRLDFSLFLGPVLLAIILHHSSLLTWLPPFLAFLFLVVAFDVAHVWASFARNYMDPLELKRRPLLYWLPLPICFLTSTLIHWKSPLLFWTIVAYIAIFHFIRQPWGFLAIYKSKAKESFDWRLDHIFIWVCALGPILVWHASPQRQFDWFGHGEQFLLRLPMEFQPFLWAAYSLFVIFYFALQTYRIKSQGLNGGKLMVQLGTLVSWNLGLQTSNPLVSAAYINLFHGIPFLALVWLYLSNKWKNQRCNGLGPRVFHYLARRQLWPLYLILFLIPALLEEMLWESFVWKGHFHQYFHSLEFSSLELSLIVGLLSLPQIVHYVLDAYIWKFNGSNPDLKKNLGLE